MYIEYLSLSVDELSVIRNSQCLVKDVYVNVWTRLNLRDGPHQPLKPEATVLIGAALPGD